MQHTLPPSSLPLLDNAGTKRGQAINGTFLYYARVVDLCMLPVINKISSQKAIPTEATNNKATMLMDYAYHYSNAILRYYASTMKLYIDSDTACLILPNTRSRGAMYSYLNDKLTNT